MPPLGACEYILGIVCVALIVPQIMSGDFLFSGPYVAPIGAIVLLLDSGMRWERMRDGGTHQYGAFEWISHRLYGR